MTPESRMNSDPVLMPNCFSPATMRLPFGSTLRSVAAIAHAAVRAWRQDMVSIIARLALHLRQTLEHLVRCGHCLRVDLVRALRLDHVDELLDDVHVRRFDVALRQRADAVRAGRVG